MRDVFDDAATGQGLLNYFLRAINCGALTEEEALSLTSLTFGELRSRSFVTNLEHRQNLSASLRAIALRLEVSQEVKFPAQMAPRLVFPCLATTNKQPRRTAWKSRWRLIAVGSRPLSDRIPPAHSYALREWRATYLRSTLSIRDCQPSPVDLK